MPALLALEARLQGRADVRNPAELAVQVIELAVAFREKTSASRLKLCVSTATLNVSNKYPINAEM